MLPDDQMLALVCHPATPARAVSAIEVRLRRGPDSVIWLTYRLSGDIGRLRVPVAQRPGPSDGLWQHTCFEMFIASGGEAAYHEFNFSPSGQWAAYAFVGYRQRDAVNTGFVGSAISPQIATRLSSEHLELDAVVAAGALPPRGSDGTLELGLSAVVEAADGSLAYWALRHGGGRPDFHQRDGFALALTDPRIAL